MSSDHASRLLAQLQDGLTSLTSSDEWRRYLNVASRFHDYSVQNTLLIFAQCPTATKVAGHRTWQSLGRQVRKGEKGIRIIAPCIRRTTVDGDNSDERAETTLTGFRLVTVFDIAQTDGCPLPEPPVHQLDRPAPKILRFQLAALIRSEGFSYMLGPMPADTRRGALGVTDWSDSAVTVREDLSPAQQAKTTAHELAHVLLHRGSHDLPDKAQREVEAESVAYIVLAAYGVDAGGYSFGYVAGWSGGDPEALQRTAGRVLGCARQVLTRLGQAGHVDEFSEPDPQHTHRGLPSLRQPAHETQDPQGESDDNIH